jgi:hypothetical protein
MIRILCDSVLVTSAVDPDPHEIVGIFLLNPDLHSRLTASDVDLDPESVF